MNMDQSTERVTLFIAESEEESVTRLKSLLADYDDFELVGAATDVETALHSIGRFGPALIFIGIGRPDRVGLTLMAELRRLEVTSCLVLMAPNEEHCIHAIRNNVFDYLLKPVLPQELNQCLLRYRYRYQHTLLEKKLDRLNLYLNRHEKIPLNSSDGMILVDPAEIFFLKADWSYTEVHLTNGNKIVVSTNLGKVTRLLDPTRFVRVNRSVIINLATLLRVDRKNHRCTLRNGEQEMEFHISSGHAQIFRDLVSR